ncbi:UNVERIFIED_ORG: NADPH:quinone reductase-like Zn-dependent oxidoreductase [Gordonia westfalica J30]
MPRVIVFDEFGGPDVMHVVDAPVPTPGGGEVRVRIEAFAVNPLDLMMRSGSSPAPVPLPHARLGIEATGIVDAVGPEVTGLSVGAPVILTVVADPVTRGTYAEYVTVPASHVIPRPAELNIVEAASIWVAFSTAYGALVETAAMQRGDRVLINAASGAVGRAAIQVAREVGAVPIAVSRNVANEDDLFDIGAAAVVTTDRDDLVEAVGYHTDGVGADIVLDLVAGPGQRQLSEAARTGATLLAAGFLDSRPAPPPVSTVTFHQYKGFVHTLDPEVVGRMAAFLSAGLRRGALRPTVATVLTLSKVADAHRLIEAGAHRGKVVITVE